MKEIDGGSAVDWGKASKDYAKYRDLYPAEFYERIAKKGLCVAGQSVLDLGTGTGVLPRNMYGFGARFTAIDASEGQIAEAVGLSRGKDIRYLVCTAEEMSFPPESFDVVTACQCFIYFDKGVVLPKIHKALRPDGHLLITWVSWLPYEDEIAGETERIVLRHNPAWSAGGYRRSDIDAHGMDGVPLFSVADFVSYDVGIPFTRESWNGRIRACRGIGASVLSEAEIAEFEKEHMEMLAGYPESFEILHHVTMFDLVKR
ncbi:MAG: class I SAM-dependent methyltransferase [Oscillospiraceae bacterium]|nr:class I SAM-dependent methyltransferase [Oscillospiraceae bacterium]